MDLNAKIVAYMLIFLAGYRIIDFLSPESICLPGPTPQLKVLIPCVPGKDQSRGRTVLGSGFDLCHEEEAVGLIPLGYR